MECETCHRAVPDNEGREHLGRMICEDCYMDALTVTRTCDPWAQHAAKSFQGKPQALCNPQEQILDILDQRGPLSPPDLLDALSGNWSHATLEREFATLKRLELIRAVKEGDHILLRRW